MRYKLIEGSLNDIFNVQTTILKNRNIDNISKYLHLDNSCEYDYFLLDNIKEAMSCFLKHVANNDLVHIVVDSDVDGYTSAAMIYKYIYMLNPFADVSYSLHTSKQHGLSPEIEIPDECQLLIIPDAGTNDTEQCKALKEKGIDIIILDHHLQDRDNPYAIIVNNQICGYPNKNLCGAGIVYKFLKALDEELWNDYSDNMLDLVALANISDDMDVREFETKYYIELGLSKIRNKALKALIEKQNYSINNMINIHSVQFYITPLINAMIRIGNQDEKDLLFRAFVETDETFEYKKRGSDEIIDENIYDRTARLCSNAKSRQSTMVTKNTKIIEDELKKNNLISENKVLFLNVTDIIGESLTGLTAIKIASKYNKPCVLLRKKSSNIKGESYFGGSIRNFSNSPIKSLKDLLISTEQFEFVLGHDNAAGVSILAKNVPKVIQLCNEKLKDIDFTKVYNVDFELDVTDLDYSFFMDIDKMKDLFGQGLSEPLVCVKNIPVYYNTVFFMGKELNTWKVVIDDSFSIIKFLVDTDKDIIINVCNDASDDDELLGYIDIIGTAGINNYNNLLTPQIIVEDYEFRKG